MLTVMTDAAACLLESRNDEAASLCCKVQIKLSEWSENGIERSSLTWEERGEWWF
jgi:hypothetical protein